MKQSAVKITFMLLAILLSACDQNPKVSSSSTGLMAERHYDPAVLAAGQATYVKHCAQCHGQQAEGHPNWRQPGPDGKYPPPPLNGSGHAWHHSRTVLRNVIKNGSPQGNMPAWKDTLPEQQIEQVIDYFQSLWPDPVYAAWIEMQQNQR